MLNIFFFVLFLEKHSCSFTVKNRDLNMFILQNTSSYPNELRHLVYILENAILDLPEGQEQVSCLIDFTGWSLRNSVPIKTAQEVAKILQNHYPERLAVFFLYNPPTIFDIFWKVQVHTSLYAL